MALISKKKKKKRASFAEMAGRRPLWQQFLSSEVPGYMVVFLVVPVLDLHCIRGKEDGGLRWAVYVVVQDAFFYLEERINQKERSAATNSSINLLSMDIEGDTVFVFGRSW